MIDYSFLRLAITVLSPASTTDRYGDTVDDWTTPAARIIQGALQAYAISETDTAGRDELVSTYRLFTNDATVQSDERITLPAMMDPLVYDKGSYDDGDGRTYVVYGTPEFYSDLLGNFHHIEVTLRVVDG